MSIAKNIISSINRFTEKSPYLGGLFVDMISNPAHVFQSINVVEFINMVGWQADVSWASAIIEYQGRRFEIKFKLID